MASFLTPLRELKVDSHQIPALGLTPNTSIQKKPLLVYHKAFNSDTSASDIEAHLSKTCVVTPHWRCTMFSRSHFHSTSHEVLVAYSGAAKLCFGEETNPGRVEVEVKAGDAMVVPAGVAHRLLDDPSGNFSMVGSYPKGYHWDMCYGSAGEEEKIKGIANLPWFDRDPIYGDEGPVTRS